MRPGLWVAFVVGVLLTAFGLVSCSGPQTEAINRRLVAAESVAYTACLTRQKAPIVAQALRDTLEDMVPGGSIARGVIAGSCDVVLANPGTTLTFTTKAQ